MWWGGNDARKHVAATAPDCNLSIQRASDHRTGGKRRREYDHGYPTL